MAILGVPPHPPPFLETLHTVLQLAFSLRSVQFAVQALRQLLWKRHTERSELWVPAAAAIAPAAPAHAPEPTPPAATRPLWSMRSPTPTGQKCPICRADMFPRATYCSPKCERIARCWVGDD